MLEERSGSDSSLRLAAAYLRARLHSRRAMYAFLGPSDSWFKYCDFAILKSFKCKN
jgi:hypothetical protein